MYKFFSGVCGFFRMLLNINYHSSCAGGRLQFFCKQWFWVGLCVLAKVLQCEVGFLILNAPAGRKAGGKKLKPRASGVIIFFFVFQL